MVVKLFRSSLVLLVAAVLSTPVLAQGQGRGTLTYLQNEPTTLFDMGIKRLRSAVLRTASQMIAKKGVKPTSSVRYKDSPGIIELEFNLITESSGDMDTLRQECIKYRRDSIIRVFQIDQASFNIQLSLKERIRRRLGAQFAHEPIASVKETLSLGEQLGEITYFSVILSRALDPAVSVTCRALAIDLMELK